MDLATTDLQSIVTIVLGATGTQISIHKDILFAHCDFVKACLNGDFEEARAGRIVLKEEDDEAFMRTLISWMYSGHASFPDISSKEQPNYLDAAVGIFNKMLMLYIMANKYIMTGFQKVIVTYISSLCQNRASLCFKALETVFNKSPVYHELKNTVVQRLVSIVNDQLVLQEQIFFITAPDAPWCQTFFDLTSQHPQIVNSVLRGLLQPGTPLQTNKEGVDGGETKSPDHKPKRRKGNK